MYLAKHSSIFCEIPFYNCDKYMDENQITVLATLQKQVLNQSLQSGILYVNFKFILEEHHTK